MATMTIEQLPLRQSPTPPPQTPTLTIDTSKHGAGPIPNKHIPYCSPGPAPGAHQQAPVTPPDTPPTKHSFLQTFSPLHPANAHPRINKSPPVYSIDASTLAKALDYQATQQLPDANQVFPWLHGLHPNNQVQLTFFIARRKSVRATPKCLRGLTIVKVGEDTTQSKLRGALTEEEILLTQAQGSANFLEVDPRDGFSVRNFQIQATKMAMVSDIVLYRDKNTSEKRLRDLAKKISSAQRAYEQKRTVTEADVPSLHTFILNNDFKEFEEHYPELVSIDSRGCSTDQVMDFFQWERQEMCSMSKASAIATNVSLGPTPDSSLCGSSTEPRESYDILIEASDLATPPDLATLKRIQELSSSAPQHLEFPSSGSIVPPPRSNSEPETITTMCEWIYSVSSADSSQDTEDDEHDADGDIQMKNLGCRPRKVLIHCADGYTETTLLGVAYYMYSEGVPLHDAWLQLHCKKQRNFFAYPSDVSLLSSLQCRILASSPRFRARTFKAALKEPAWLSRMDGSLPSRILPYMYLGNLGHANNPDLLRSIGIAQVLSVGEPVNWSKGQLDKWGSENLLLIDRVQDNGVDPLLDEFERCLDFIRKSNLESSVPPSLYRRLTAHRERQSQGHSDPRPLPRWRLPLRNHLHRRSHVLSPPLFPTRIVSSFLPPFSNLRRHAQTDPLQLLRPRPPPQRHHPAAPTLRLRTPQMGRSTPATTRRAATEGARMGHDSEGDCGHE